jgi:hypothetical protein
MKNTRTAYLIFVRPPGSQMWTQHMKAQKGIPYTSYKRQEAEYEAVRVTCAKHYCTRVVPVEHPREIDEALYSQMADGDVRFHPVGP